MAEKPSWQNQSFAKNGGGSGPSTMNSKIAGNSIMSMNSKIGKPTVRNYADGGEVSGDPQYDQGEFAGVDKAIAAQSAASDNTGVEVTPVREPAVEAKEVKPQSFKEAFAENRKAGNSTFEWNGKQYTTEMASAKPAPRAEAKPSVAAGKTFAQDVAERKAANSVQAKVASSMTRNENYGNEGRRTVNKPTGRGVIDTSNIDSKTLLPKR